MNDDNVTSMGTHKLAELILTEWLDSMSDNGAVWRKSHRAVRDAKAKVSVAVFEEAFEIAQDKWRKIHNVTS
jgi:hypothetical protein